MFLTAAATDYGSGDALTASATFPLDADDIRTCARCHSLLRATGDRVDMLAHAEVGRSLRTREVRQARRRERRS